MKYKSIFRISLITLSILIPMFLASCKKEPNTAPVATFTFTPGTGTTETTFNFDASGVTDIEDPATDLQVRWAWESDTFNTDFSTTKIITHKFNTGGTKNVTLEVKDTKGLTSRCTNTIKVTGKSAPKAALNVTPRNGFLQDIFKMDASASSDADTKQTDLQVRFDYEGDGTWDTEYSTVKIVNHQFTEANTYTVKVIVKDKDDLTNVVGVVIKVLPTNLGPEAPKDPVPADKAPKASTLGVLTWTCADPESDSLKYDIYFGRDENPPKVATDKAGAKYESGPLEYATLYYWKVVAKDPYAHESTSPVWSFTTGSPIYPVGSFTDTRDGKKYKTVTINNQIWMAQNLNIGTMIDASSGGDRNDGYQMNNKKAEKYCYKNDPANCDIYGGLYQWDEAMAYGTAEKATGICPDGWHLPTNTEWHELVMFLDPTGAEDKAGDLLVIGSLSGFQALFSGYMIFAEHKFYDLGNAGYFWSSTMNADPQLSHLALIRSIYRGRSAFQKDTSQKYNGLPVRCIKDY